MYATGRTADTAGLCLDKAGVTVNKNGKISVTGEVTNVPHIYAVGDIVEGGLELTPVAIKVCIWSALRRCPKAVPHLQPLQGGCQSSG